MNHSRWTATTLAIAVVAVVAASTFTFLAFTRDDGAASPEAAATAMIDTIEQGDLLGALEQLPPGERRVLHDQAGDLGAQLQRLGLISSFNGGHLEGFDPAFDHPQFTTTELSKDMVAVDLVGGQVRVPLAPGAAPPLTEQGRRVLERAGWQVDPNSSELHRDFSTDPLRLVAIREGGGWHLSLAYSVAEAMRKESGAKLPEMGKGPPATGAATPEAAVRDFLRAYADGDPERVLTLMHPDEARAAYDYAPAFLPTEKAAAKAAAEQGTYDVQLNKVDLDTSGSGPMRSVKVTGLDLDARDELDKVHVTYDGRCLHTDERIGDHDDPFAKSDTCDGDWGGDDVATRNRANPVANLAVFGGGADLPTFVVVEREGRWFISPARTALDSIVHTLQEVPADKLDVLADRWGASWRAGVGDGLSGHPIEGSPPEEPTDDERRVAKAAALADGCAHLATGDQAAGIGRQCVQHLVDTHRVDLADLPDAAREGVQPAAG